MWDVHVDTSWLIIYGCMTLLTVALAFSFGYFEPKVKAD